MPLTQEQRTKHADEVRECFYEALGSERVRQLESGDPDQYVSTIGKFESHLWALLQP